jgi:hypothetical protein
VKLLGIVIALCVAGCGHINHLRDAQDAFSRAAEAENRIASAPPDRALRVPSAGTNDLAQISAGYAAAVVSLDKLEDDTKAVEKLKSDGLYGNALALRAMSYWRLQKYDEARKAASSALDSGLARGSRDFALMTALPGLVANDKAYAQIQAATKDSLALDPVLAELNTADAVLCDADRSVAANHPVRVYLGVSALAAMKNVQDACDKKHGASTGAADRCFKGDPKLQRDQRAHEYHKRLIDLGVPAADLDTFVQGVIMNAGSATPPYCGRP